MMMTLDEASLALASAHGRLLNRWKNWAGRFDHTNPDDEEEGQLFFGMRLPWLMSHYMWPFIFSVVFMTALLSGVTIARARAAQGQPVYFHPLAVSEALVSITAGVLLWMGVWDLLDEYLVPEEWWAKLFMLAAGGFALFSTRTLYDEKHVGERVPRVAKNGAYSSVAVNGADDDESDRGSGGCFGFCRRATSAPGSAIGVELQAPPTPPDVEDGPTVHHSPWVHLRESTVPTEQPAGDRPRRYFDRPAFNCTKCGRSLFVIIAGLTMWAGLWDLVDEHLLPFVFDGCRDEPSAECALVKLGVILVRPHPPARRTPPCARRRTGASR